MALNPDRWMSSLFDEFQANVISAVQEYMGGDEIPVQILMDHFVSSNIPEDDKPVLIGDMGKPIIHFNIDHIDNNPLGFGRGVVSGDETQEQYPISNPVYPPFPYLGSPPSDDFGIEAFAAFKPGINFQPWELELAVRGVQDFVSDSWIDYAYITDGNDFTIPFVIGDAGWLGNFWGNAYPSRDRGSGYVSALIVGSVDLPPVKVKILRTEPDSHVLLEILGEAEYSADIFTNPNFSTRTVVNEYAGRSHVVNFDVGAVCTPEAGGSSARLRLYEMMDYLFNGVDKKRAFESDTGGIEILSFNAGHFALDKINDVQTFRIVGAELVARVYSRDVASDPVVIVDEEPIQHPNVEIGGIHIVDE